MSLLKCCIILLQSLIYSQDNETPVLFEDSVQDRHAKSYGITSFLVLGTVFQCLLTWQDNLMLYVHNFTLSVYPKHTFSVYSHSCFVRKLNSSGKSDVDLLNSHVAHFGESYFKELINIDDKSDGGYSYKASTFDKLSVKYDEQDTKEGTGEKYSEHSKNDKDLIENERLRDSDFGSDKGGESKHTFSLMSFNIWNMNPLGPKKDGYTSRMQRFKKVRLYMTLYIVIT